MLRKAILIVTACVLLAGTATAGLGVKAGLNFSSIDLDDLAASSRTGFAGGVFLSLPIPFMSLQGELLYTVKGLRKGQSTASNEEIDYREHLIEIPVLYKISLPIPLVSPSAYAGPAVSFPLRGEVKSGGKWQKIEGGDDGKVWSLIFGVDVTLAKSLVIDLRYAWGLSQIRETDFGIAGAKNESIKDRTFTVTVGYKF